ncbi:MAG: MATE family efflux transporter [Bryobacteraceae bacterium]
MSQPASASAEASSFSRLWPAVREAVAGTRQDFTEGSIGRGIFLLAIPTVLEMVMESLFGVVNVYFVGRLGSDAVATVGVTEAMFTLLFPIAMGLAMSAAAMVARRIGEKNASAAAESAVQAIAVGIGVAVVAGVLGATFAGDLLRLMGATPGQVAGGTGYARILLGGSGTVVLLFLMNAIFRGAGDAAIAMRVLTFANLINIALVPCLINGWGPFPQLGLAGAAVGTTIGRGAGVLYQLSILLSARSRISITRTRIRLHPDIMYRLLRTSMHGTFQFAIAHLSWLGLTRIISTFGTAAMAGYTIALRILVFTILPSWGLASAAATMVGQNLGARKPERSEAAVWHASWYNAAFLGAIAIVYMTAPEPFMRLFSSDATVVSVGAHCMRFVSAGYPFFAFGMVIVQAFNGAGDTATPTRVNLFCYWLWEIPLALVLGKELGMGPDGVFLAIAIAESTTAVVGLALFRRGRWKTLRI